MFDRGHMTKRARLAGSSMVLTALLAGTIGAATQPAPPPAAPNIVIILPDDFGTVHPSVVTDLVREAEAHRRTVVAGRPLFDELLPQSPEHAGGREPK